jgi:hypothetical protein
LVDGDRVLIAADERLKHAREGLRASSKVPTGGLVWRFGRAVLCGAAMASAAKVRSRSCCLRRPGAQIDAMTGEDCVALAIIRG